MIVEVEHPDGGKIKQTGISVKLSDTPGQIRSLAPRTCQHTDEVLTELGYPTDEIKRLKKEGAIR
jgi:crotonobetainyl-CoA:carnitine CoA-transferase CaiB-like acyl-CoA transferase